MPERVILDPSELAGSRTQLDLTPWLDVEGIDWGDQSVESFRASGEFGDQIIDTRYPNRQVTAGLMLKTVGGTSFATVRSLIQAKAALYQQSGGWLKRITASGGTFYADIQQSGLTLSGAWLQANKSADTDASVTFELSPDYYGNEVQLADHVETSAAELVFTETSVQGDLPARVRVVVDEDQGQAQLGLIWGFRKRNYSSAATARLQYEAEALQPLDTATKVALTGASGGTVVTHGTLSTNWTPVLNMNLGGTAYLTHVGTYRWWCRYRTTSGTAVQLRGVYDVGDLVLPEENDRWTHPAGTGGTSFYIADLGQIRLDQVPVGTHRWAGMIQSKGDVGGENVSLDRVWFQPLDESAGLLRAPNATGDLGLVAYSARSEFTTEAGAITGDTATVGGVWAGAGDADDFLVGSGVATRTVTSGAPDADLNTGRYIVSGVSAFAAQAVQMDLWRDAAVSGDARFGVLARYTDTSNWLLGHLLFPSAGSDPVYLCVTKRVAGTVTELGRVQVAANNGLFMGGTQEVDRYKIRLVVNATGVWQLLWSSRTAASLAVVLTGVDSVLATGGTLASGKPGFYHAKSGGSSSTVTVDNFLAWAPIQDAVLNPSKSLELRWDGIVRQDVGGTAYGPVSWIEGDLPRLPPTTEGGTVEVFIKASRGDFLTLPDTGIDDISARTTSRYCWLHPNS